MGCGCEENMVSDTSVLFRNYHQHCITLHKLFLTLSFLGGSDGKESACNAGYLCSIPRSGRSPGEGNGYPLQYSCLENPMDRGVWQAAAYEVTESDTTEVT